MRKVVMSYLIARGYRWNDGGHLNYKSEFYNEFYIYINLEYKTVTYSELSYRDKDFYDVSFSELISILENDEAVEHTQMECGIPYEIVEHSMSHWIGTQVIKNIHNNKVYWSVYKNCPFTFVNPLVFDNPTKFKKVKER